MVEGDRLLHRTEVERRVGIGTSTLYRMMRDGEFPEPLKIGARAVRWPESEIETWLGTLPRAKGVAADGRLAT